MIIAAILLFWYSGFIITAYKMPEHCKRLSSNEDALFWTAILIGWPLVLFHYRKDLFGGYSDDDVESLLYKIRFSPESKKPGAIINLTSREYRALMEGRIA